MRRKRKFYVGVYTVVDMKGVYPVLTTDAFILHTRGVGEADRIVTALTRSRGLMHVYARSVRKEGAKMRGAVKPYGKVTLSVIIGKRNILKDIVTTDTLCTIWADEDKYTAFVRLLRFTHSLIPVAEEYDDTIFSVIENVSCFLCESHPLPAKDALLAAQVMILTTLGYIPECSSASESFTEVVSDISSSPRRRREFSTHLKNALLHQ